MNRFLPTKGRSLVTLLAGALLAGTLMPEAESVAQSSGYRASGYQESGYQAPVFAGMGAPSGGGAQLIPSAFPASMLAGGPAAAQGGEFMDVQGRRIELTNYCPSCPQGGGCPGGGYCGPGAGGAGGSGDPMAVDFGGYGQDQCGPHYFDVSVDAVFLQAEDPFGGVGPLFSAGISGSVAQGNRMDVLSGREEFEAGWRIAARYDIGPLAVIEGTYMGIYDIGFNSTVTSGQALEAIGQPPTPNFLFSVFSDFGTAATGPIATLDDANVYAFNYESDLQSTELSYRRYWVGQNPRVSGTFLLGARYLRMTEGFTWDIQAFLNGDPNAPANSRMDSTSENDLVGCQFGGDGWLCLRQGLRVGIESKAGIYNNRFKLNRAGVFDQVGNAPANFSIESEGNQVAFAAEGGVTFVADILSSWSIRGGYQVMYLSSLATVGGNLDTVAIGSPATSTQDDALYQGFHGGVEYVW